MSGQKTVLVLAPRAAEQARADALAAALKQEGATVQQLMIEGHVGAVLDALEGSVVPVVVK
jgi:hypothetical protein